MQELPGCPIAFFYLRKSVFFVFCAEIFYNLHNLSLFLVSLYLFIVNVFSEDIKCNKVIFLQQIDLQTAICSLFKVVDKDRKNADPSPDLRLCQPLEQFRNLSGSTC
mgnify:CR=1 FL=1